MDLSQALAWFTHKKEMVILTLSMNDTEREYDIRQLTISKVNVKKIFGPENPPGDYLCRKGF